MSACRPDGRRTGRALAGWSGRRRCPRAAVPAETMHTHPVSLLIVDDDAAIVRTARRGGAPARLPGASAPTSLAEAQAALGHGEPSTSRSSISRSARESGFDVIRRDQGAGARRRDRRDVGHDVAGVGDRSRTSSSAFAFVPEAVRHRPAVRHARARARAPPDESRQPPARLGAADDQRDRRRAARARSCSSDVLAERAAVPRPRARRSPAARIRLKDAVTGRLRGAGVRRPARRAAGVWRDGVPRPSDRVIATRAPYLRRRPAAWRSPPDYAERAAGASAR